MEEGVVAAKDGSLRLVMARVCTVLLFKSLIVFAPTHCGLQHHSLPNLNLPTTKSWERVVRSKPRRSNEKEESLVATSRHGLKRPLSSTQLVTCTCLRCYSQRHLA
jgi:hypothetical protein